MGSDLNLQFFIVKFTMHVPKKYIVAYLQSTVWSCLFPTPHVHVYFLRHFKIALAK